MSPPKGVGAVLSVGGTFEHTPTITGTKSWMKVSFEFDTGKLIACGLVLGLATTEPGGGTAWFDELSLVEVGPARKPQMNEAPSKC